MGPTIFDVEVQFEIYESHNVSQVLEVFQGSEFMERILTLMIEREEPCLEHRYQL
jgi:hypothetical protein